MNYITVPIAVLIVVFLSELMLYNFLMPNQLPRFPGDIDLRKGITLYIPFTSAIVISAILSITYFNFF